jgi:selenoprotein W-related protein
MTKASGPRIAIRYCTQCHSLLRAAWMAQELLSTFGTDLGEVSLQPGTGGIFVITYDGEVIWERKADGGFPDVKQLKQRVRDHLDPDRDLGHLDRLPIDQATGRHDRFHYAGSPGAGSVDVEARSGPKLALEPQQGGL